MMVPEADGDGVVAAGVHSIVVGRSGRTRQFSDGE